MNSFKSRLKTYSFWVSLSSALLLLAQNVSKPFGFVIDEGLYMSIVNSVLGVFVVLGIITHPSQKLIDDKNKIEETIGSENEINDQIQLTNEQRLLALKKEILNMDNKK